MVGVATGGLSYEDAATLVDDDILATSLAGWNLQRTNTIETADDAIKVAETVISSRLAAIGQHADLGDSVELRVGTRLKPRTADAILSMD